MTASLDVSAVQTGLTRPNGVDDMGNEAVGKSTLKSRRRRKPPTQEIKPLFVDEEVIPTPSVTAINVLEPPHVLDPDIIRMEQQRRGQPANEKRHEDALPTPQQRAAIVAYFAEHPSGRGAVKHFMREFGWTESKTRRRIKSARAQGLSRF
jgi:hypothetical protein